MAQLVEWSPPIPKVRSSNPVIGKNLYSTFIYFFIINCIEIRGREWPTLQKQLLAETKRLRSSQLMPNNCCYYLIISNCTIGTCFKAFVLAQKFYFSFSIRLKHIQAAWAETDRIGFLDLILQPWARSYKENDIVTYCFAQM